MNSLRGKAAVAGVVESQLGKVPGKSTFALAADACQAGRTGMAQEIEGSRSKGI